MRVCLASALVVAFAAYADAEDRKDQLFASWQAAEPARRGGQGVR
jgi:hypothetical protein